MIRTRHIAISPYFICLDAANVLFVQMMKCYVINAHKEADLQLAVTVTKFQGSGLLCKTLTMKAIAFNCDRKIIPLLYRGYLFVFV